MFSWGLRKLIKYVCVCGLLSMFKLMPLLQIALAFLLGFKFPSYVGVPTCSKQFEHGTRLVTGVYLNSLSATKAITN